MSAAVVDLKGARVDRDARILAHLDKTLASEIAKSSEKMSRFMEWLLMQPAQRAEVADELAREIAVRYQPIASQFKNALYDALVLHIAGAQESGEDLATGLLRGLMLMMSDERYIGIATHIVSEPLINAAGPEHALEYRRRNPTPITVACDGLFEAYAASRKK